MLKVMIADDERIIRETISQLIDWNSLELELVGVCQNGIEAFDMFQDESPDIVLTDIKMPGLSGLELIARISANNRDTQFILLSGYGEFDYAREAMKYGVRHYLLKPCAEEQIVAGLREAAEECYRHRATHRAESAQTRGVLYHNIIVEILNELAMTADDCHAQVYEPYRKYLDFDNEPYDLLYLHGVREEEMEDVYEQIRSFHSDHTPGLPLHGVYVPGTLMMFCKKYEGDPGSVKTMLDSLARGEDGLRFTQEGHRLASLSVLLDALWSRASRFGTLRYLGNLHPVSSCNYRGVIQSVKTLCGALRALRANPSAQGGAAQEKVEELLKILSGVINPDFLLQLCSSVLLSFSNDSLLLTPVEATERMIELQSCAGAEEINASFAPWLRELFRTPGGAERDQLVARIQSCVRDHLDNPDLTLKWIAETYLFMNVDYVSRKFARETGCKFSKYLTDTRIQYAKQLLTENSAEKIQSVAEQVGCGNNPQYFSQIFKKSTGMSPSAYAKMLGTRQH